jgi:hypothetical protein
MVAEEEEELHSLAGGRERRMRRIVVREEHHIAVEGELRIAVEERRTAEEELHIVDSEEDSLVAEEGSLAAGTGQEEEHRKNVAEGNLEEDILQQRVSSEIIQLRGIRGRRSLTTWRGTVWRLVVCHRPSRSTVVSIE